ncbi:hypothetical protein ACL9RL_09280 [Plantibacter sp. Mn2098]|uniref:hypothetical protein n=1 Tax=Plantibacter sp. Mn2098 TaxID=3395266 RepID=UPI003BC74473
MNAQSWNDPGGFQLLSTLWGSPEVNDGVGSFVGGALTITTPGWYDITAYLRLTAARTPFGLRVMLNSTNPADFDQTIAYDAPSGSSVNATAITTHKLAVGDVLRVYAFVAAGSAAGSAKQDAKFDLRFRRGE